jgi:uncharacterized protein (DUF433 family)
MMRTGVKGIGWDPEMRGGIPVVEDTRIPFSFVLAELADGRTLRDIAEDFDIAPERLTEAVKSLADSWNVKFSPLDQLVENYLLLCDERVEDYDGARVIPEKVAAVGRAIDDLRRDGEE